jgi:mannose-6-phosphate isomerase
MEPQLLEKVWGGRRLARLGKSLPPNRSIGESWEVADLGATSDSGAGGQAVRSLIADGPLRGRPLHDALVAWGPGFTGGLPLTSTGELPLLVKFLDASENLSVQVHPSPAYAESRPGSHLKTESWYIVESEPGAALYIGLRPGVSLAEFARASRAGSSEVADMLARLPAVPGECHTLPSGTVHALGAGVTVAEVQTPSDTTFRLYDWGRPGRTLHIEPALESMADPSIPAPSVSSVGPEELCGRVASTAFYTIDEAHPPMGDAITIGYACKHTTDAPFVLVVLDGEGELCDTTGRFSPRLVQRGQTWVIPAALTRRISLRAGADLRVLRIGMSPPF